jgi:two-component sensor histidine kinase
MSNLVLLAEERAALVNEIHHRVKNNLAVISSLLTMKAASADLPEVKTAISGALCRIRAMALAHEHVYGSENLDQIDFRGCIEDLAQEVSTVFDQSQGRISVTVDATRILLEVAQAIPCAIIVNELLANTFTHAFPGGSTGKVFVGFRKAPDGYLELTVQDNGVGSADDPPEIMESSGLEIVEILAKQLEGSVERELGGGTRTVVRFPFR